MAIIAISGKKGHGKNLLATVIQYLVYCDLMLQQHPTFKYPTEKFMWQVLNIKGFTFTKEETGWESKSLAHKLKACSSIILGVPIEKFEDQDFKLTNLPACWDRYFWRDYKGKKHKIEYDPLNLDAYEKETMTVRQFLQLFGTEGCRDGVHDNFWVNALMSEYLPHSAHWTNDDFPNWIVSDCRFINEADAFKASNGLIFRINRNIESNDNHPSEVGLDDYVADATITNDDGIGHIINQARDILEHFNII